MSQEAHVTVTIEVNDAVVLYRNWIGTSIKAIHRVARKQYKRDYPGALVSFGLGYYRNFYGAH